MRTRWSFAAGAWILFGTFLAVAVVDEIHPLLPPDSGRPTLVADAPVDSEPPADGGDEDVDGIGDADGLPTGLEDGNGSIVDTYTPVEPDITRRSLEGIAAVWPLNDGEGIPLIGYRDDIDFNVVLPAGWTATDGVLAADIAVSEQARIDTSIRVDVAGQPVGSWSTREAPQLVLPVPFDRIEDSEISVDFVATTPLEDDPVCLDPNHVARWVEVENARVAARLVPAEIDLARAVRGIGAVSAATAEPVHFVISGEPSAGALEVIGNMAAAIGHYGLPDGWTVNVSGQPSLRRGAQVWIVERPGISARAAVRVVDDRPVIELVGDVGGLVRLSDALADPERIDYFHYDQVEAADVPTAPADSLREVFRFEEDGYDDRTLRGIGPQSLIYRVHIPAGVPPDAATLALYATHSPYLAKVESTISVRINGSPEEIVAVADESGQLDVLHTVAPADLRPGLNYVKITTHLAGPAGAADGCGGSGSSTGWFTISNSSGLGVERPPELQKVRLGVEDARFALATPIDFEGTDVAIADGGDVGDVELGVEVIGHLANRAQGGSPRLVIDRDVDLARHVVVVGVHGDRDLLESVPKASRGDEGDSGGVDRGDALPFGMVAAQPSPYTNGKVLMAFTGPTIEGVRRAVEATMSSEVNDVTDNFALVSPDLVRPVGDGDVRFEDLDPARAGAGDLAFADDGDRRESSGSTPAGEEYDEWVLEQARRIEAAQQVEQDRRRMIALVLLVFVSIVAGLWWINRTRRRDQAGGH